MTKPSRAEIKKMYISLILQEGAAPELIENIRQLTMAAAKFDRNRGDKLTIMTASFRERRDQRSAEQIMLKNIAEKIELLEQKREIEEIFSKSLRAGRRTYFFDVRSTRAGDYYMTITESKRDFNEDGTPYYKKHKIYLYKEDFINFKDNLEEVTNYIFEQKGEDIITSDEKKSEKTSEQSSSSDFTEVNLDEIDSTKDS